MKSKTTLILFIFLIAGVSSVMAKILNEAEFIEYYIEKLNKSVEGLSFEIKDNMEITIIHENQNKVQAYLSKAYYEYKAQPEKLDQLTNKHIAGLTPFLTNIDALNNTSLEIILPVVRDKIFVEEFFKQFKDVESSELPYYEDINNDLKLLYVYDDSLTMRYLLNSQVQDLGFSKEALYKKAIQNFNNHLDSLKYYPDSGFIMMSLDGDYESSLILVDWVWEQVFQNVKTEDIIIMVLARDVVVATTIDNQLGIKTIKERALNLKNNVGSLYSENFIRKINGNWEIYKP